MKIEELRSGNLVKQGSQITEIDFSSTINLKYILEDLDLYEGIPLTNQYMQDYGFIRQPWGYVKSINRSKSLLVSAYISEGKETFYIELGNGLRINLDFVHQLQNIFFAITNKSLTK